MKHLLLIFSLVLILSGCQSINEKQFGICEERPGSVSPSCLYNGEYSSCKLQAAEYLLAQDSAWQFSDASFSVSAHVNSGQSQDLGDECRFYFYVKPELNSAKPYQWFVYIDKSTLKPIKIEPVAW